MYELLVKLNDELEYRKYTIKDLEEIKALKEELSECIEFQVKYDIAIVKCAKLVEEIERLNNILDGYEKEMDNLINARDKAIEYIELRSNTNLYDKNKLLEILKGSE